MKYHIKCKNKNVKIIFWYKLTIYYLFEIKTNINFFSEIKQFLKIHISDALHNVKSEKNNSNCFYLQK